MLARQMAAASVILALTAGCNDAPGGAQKAPLAPIAAGGDCPDAPAPLPASGKPAAATTTMIGQPLKLPPLPAVQVVVNAACFPAGHTIPLHKHPWQRYVFLESGSLTVSFDAPQPNGAYGAVANGTAPAAKSLTFSAGDLLVESTDTWHSVKVGNAPVRLVVVDQMPSNYPRSGNVIPAPEASHAPAAPGR
jgi:quercetin dioxygenase-like cupin family protein